MATIKLSYLTHCPPRAAILSGAGDYNMYRHRQYGKIRTQAQLRVAIHDAKY